jgi:23S rRNA (guanine2445-N2)-methyltransferase / 23S rRNA (guanine2069-N7)-methyltransferase
VNFTDYLDTGLFLDHRRTRALLKEMARGARFLNLFGYTGAATVYAAAGGARETTTVDLSRRYLDWARDNMELNGFSGESHRYVRADALRWLEGEKGPYDLIFLDPPTFSTSNAMEGTLDVQRDHADLILKAARLLAPGGTLAFSTNYRRFRLDASALTGLTAADITARTIPPDFERNPRVHQTWLIERSINDRPIVD